ncbi:hypothetical protein D3C87_2081430 [compost metagenome]
MAQTNDNLSRKRQNYDECGNCQRAVVDSIETGEQAQEGNGNPAKRGNDEDWSESLQKIGKGQMAHSGFPG